MKKYFSICSLILIAMILFIANSYSYDFPKWLRFNKEEALQEWKEKIFRNKVIYAVQSEQEDGYLVAKSDEACSGLTYDVRFKVKEFPMISWRWKVNKFPKHDEDLSGEGGWIERDDFAARFYVIFPCWNFGCIKSIEYIWDDNLPEETVMTSPYWKNIKLIVAESGTKNRGQWAFEERNIYDDYKKAFGRPAPKYVGSIALMTDSDNTMSSAETLYKDIRVGYTNEEK